MSDPRHEAAGVRLGPDHSTRPPAPTARCASSSVSRASTRMVDDHVRVVAKALVHCRMLALRRHVRGRGPDLPDARRAPGLADRRPETADMTSVEEGPRKVYVEPTNACNLACATCVRHSWDEPEGFMEWATFEAVVDGLGRRAGTLAFMGLGEPLLHPRFLDMVRLAKERGLRAEVTTNALLLDDAMAAGLLEAGLDQLVVSIDGASAEAFGRVRSGASLDARGRERAPPARRPRRQLRTEHRASASSSSRCAPTSASSPASAGSPRSSARPSSSSATCSRTRRTCSPRRSTTTARARSSGAVTTAAPRWQLPAFDWDRQLGAALGEALTRSGPISFFGADQEATRSRCPFVHADACAVAWHGGVSPCPPLLHTYTCFVRGREKRMLRWEVGRVPERAAADDLGGAGLRRVPRPGPALRLPAVHRLWLRPGRGQRRGLPRQPAPDVRRLPVGARRHPLRVSRTVAKELAGGVGQSRAPISRSSASLAFAICILNSMGRRICFRLLIPAPEDAVRTTMSP